MKIRLPLACLLFWVLAAIANAQQLKCDICGEPISKKFYRFEDRVTGEQKKACQACENLEARCFVCGLPVKDGGEKLPDGRILCAREAREAVSSEAEAREISVEVRDELDRLFSRFLTIPDTNVVVTIADRYQLENLFRAPGNESACVTVYGATSTHPLPGHKFIHYVNLLSYLKKSRLMAVCAHEYTHAWMGENVSHERNLLIDRDTKEGFCELVAYKYMVSRQETADMQIIRKNNYTKGQIDVLIEADNKYGFDAVMEWIKSGEDNKLDMANLDRVRALKDGSILSSAPTTSALLIVSPAAPTPVPNTLKLKGISGAGQHRFALINDTTFEALERGRVRVGQTNVVVQCLEIRSDSVVIQVAGSNKKEELFLRTNQ